MNKEPVSITIHRYRQDPVLGTLGRLSMTSGLSGGYLFRCVTLENPWRDADDDGKSDNIESRVRAGSFRLGKDLEGRFVRRYKKRFNHPFVPKLLPIDEDEKWHRSEILIHVGNSHIDTHGCILVGLRANDNNFSIYQSTVAYKRLFDAIVRYNPERVLITQPDDWQ